jgi:hypothetical protein
MDRHVLRAIVNGAVHGDSALVSADQLMAASRRDWNLVTSRERYEELTSRDMSARTAAKLRERGEFDPGKLGHRLVAEAQPLIAEERLELMAHGEVLAR